MIIRKLEQWEHGQTRRLYENVFAEDSAAFVDYYYRWKTKDSRIYAAQEDGEIRAMVHLNPFQMYVKGEVQTVYYIVAVATQQEYRHRGLMRRLMAMAEQEAEEEGVKFLFLMPASEKIYTPLGYRFFCSQRKGVLTPDGILSAFCRRPEKEERAKEAETTAKAETAGKAEPAGEAELTGKTEATGKAELAGEMLCRALRAEEYEKMAEFTNRVLASQYDVFVFRSAAYYERLCAEQRAQNGEVMAVVCGDCIAGTFCTSKEEKDKTELRELIADPARLPEVEAAVMRFAAECGGCSVAGCSPGFPLEQESSVPLLMGKIPGGGLLQEWEAGRIFINEVV